MPFLKFESKSIFYDSHGSGEPLLLLHGFLENATMWDDFLSDLKSSYQVFRIDLPGHGKSENLDRHSMDKMAEVVLFVLDFLSVQKVNIVGHSMGGYVALALADKNPKLVKQLMLFFSSAAADTAEKRTNRDRLKAIVHESKNSFLRHAIPMLFTSQTRQLYAEKVNLLIAEAQELNTDGIVKTIDGLKTRPDRIHLLEKDIPVSFVSGKLDEAITLESLKDQHSAKAVKKVWLTENGHMGHIEDRDFCLAAIRNFMA